MNDKREFIINELMVENFVEWETQKIRLEETEDSGKSVLTFQLSSDVNLCIKNVDKKKTEMLFFQNDKIKSMFKRVDHIIFEQLNDDSWKLHLIEMKSWVGNKRWTEVKGKFRASYLLAQGIVAMLEIKITETCMYTTYERVDLSLPETMPSARRLPLGGKNIRPEEEWSGKDFGLNFGERLKFMHFPIQMERDTKDILQGEYICGV